MNTVKSSLNSILKNQNDLKYFNDIIEHLHKIMIFAYTLQKIFFQVYFGIKNNNKIITKKYSLYVKLFKKLKFNWNNNEKGIDIFADNVTSYILYSVIGSYINIDKECDNNIEIFKFLLDKVYKIDVKNNYLDKINGVIFDGLHTFIPPMMVQMTTCNKNNIREHYKEYISRLINIVFLETNDPITRNELIQLYKNRKILNIELSEKQYYDKLNRKLNNISISKKKKNKLEKNIIKMKKSNPNIDNINIDEFKISINNLNIKIDELKKKLNKYTIDEKKTIKMELSKIKKSLFTGESHKNKEFSKDIKRNKKYIKWLNKNRKLIIPDKLDEDNINYTAKSKTMECFMKSININNMIEHLGFKPYNILPNPTSLIPTYSAITSQSLIFVFQDKKRRLELTEKIYNRMIVEHFGTKEKMINLLKIFIHNEMCNKKLEDIIRKFENIKSTQLYSLIGSLFKNSKNLYKLESFFEEEVKQIPEKYIKNLNELIKRIEDFNPPVSFIISYSVCGKYLFDEVFNLKKLKSGKDVFNEIIYTDGKAVSVLFINKKKIEKTEKFNAQIKEVYPNIENLDEDEKTQLLDNYILTGLDPGKNKLIQLAGKKVISSNEIIKAEEKIHKTINIIDRCKKCLEKYNELVNNLLKKYDKTHDSIIKLTKTIKDIQKFINWNKEIRKQEEHEFDKLKIEYDKLLDIKIKEKEIEIKNINKNIKEYKNMIYNLDNYNNTKIKVKKLKRYMRKKKSQKEKELQLLKNEKNGYMKNGDIKNIKYSLNSGRWRHDTLMTKNNKIRENMKNTNEEIKKILEELSKKTYKTMNYTKYKEFWEIYMKNFNKLNDFYKNKTFRNLKFETYIGKQKMEAQIIKEIKNIYLDNHDNKKLAIFYGMWGGSNHLGGFYSVPNKWIKNMLAKYFTIIDIDEYCTSKKYYKTGEELTNWKNPVTNKKIHTVFLTKYTNSKEEIIDVFVNRDDNGSINIYNCGISILEGNGRLNHLKRPIKSGEEAGKKMGT